MIDRQPKVTVVFDRKKKATLSKRGALEIRIAYNYQQKYISTGIMLYANQWRKGNIVNCPDMLILCTSLNHILSNIRTVLTAMLEEGNVNLGELPQKLQKLHAPRQSFIEYCKQRAAVRKYGRKKDSQERYDRFIRLFEEWGVIRDFSDIKEDTILKYDQYLYNKGMGTYSRWNNYHRFLNGFISDAIKERLLHKNPYDWLNISREKSRTGIDKYLTLEELNKIKTAAMPTECLEKVRDLFVFQTYTCLRYSDLAAFDSTRIKEIKGTPVYMGDSIKTNRRFTIPLLSSAVSILDKYNNKLPIISNVKYNLYLKAVAQAAGINKPISSHWARHTGATILLNKGTEMRIITKVCGHSSTRITEQVYAKLLDESVVDALSNIDI